MSSATVNLAILLFTSCELFRRVSSEGPSDWTFNLLTVLSGDYDNIEQVLEDKISGIEYDQVRLIPIDIIALHPLNAPVLVFEDGLDKHIVRLQIRLIVEESPGFLKMIVYNVTEPSYYKKPPWTITSEEFANIKLEDLQLLVNCSAEFQVFENRGFTGGWQNCLDRKHGARSHYGCTFECEFIRCYSSEHAPEKLTLLPYELKRKGPKYAVPGLPDKFVSFCDKTD